MAHKLFTASEPNISEDVGNAWDEEIPNRTKEIIPRA